MGGKHVRTTGAGGGGGEGGDKHEEVGEGMGGERVPETEWGRWGLRQGMMGGDESGSPPRIGGGGGGGGGAKRARVGLDPPLPTPPHSLSLTHTVRANISLHTHTASM